MTRTVFVTILLALLSAPAIGQQPQSAQPQAPQGFDQYLFPPELVMRYGQRIGLQPGQRDAITAAIQEFQSAVVDLQWQMQDETQQLSELLEESSVDETAVLARVDRVLEVERQVKRAHLTLLIRIKNALTSEQQYTLKSLRTGGGQ